MVTDTGPTSIFDRRVLVIACAGGFLGGFFGVGGGMFMVPLIMYFLAPPRRVAHATSLGAIVALSTAGMIGFALDGHVDWATGIALGVGGVLGAMIGATWMNRLSPYVLKLIFSAVFIVAGLRMVI